MISFVMEEYADGVYEDRTTERIEIFLTTEGGVVRSFESRTAPLNGSAAITMTRLQDDGQLEILDLETCETDTIAPPGGMTMRAVVRDTIGAWHNPRDYGFTKSADGWIAVDDDIMYRLSDRPGGDLVHIHTSRNIEIARVTNRSLRESATPRFTIDNRSCE